MSESSVKTGYFGTVSLGDADALLMDGGMHGVQGHTLRIDQGATASWERRVDSFRPQGTVGDGALELTAEERGWLEGALTVARQLALEGNTRFFGDGPPRPPRFVWAIVLRHPERPLLLEGGGMALTATPPELTPLLSWLRERVDRAASVGT